MSRLSATQQKKYLGKLRGAERAAREAEILYRREHRSDEPFVTDEGQPTKRSRHAIAFEREYGRTPQDTADAARLSGVPKKILDEVYARGMAAWQTGHRPGASQHAWAMARVESFLTGGPTSKTADADLAREAKMRNPEDQTQTPAFKRWFGNSKVVDANGKPLVVYHGTQKGGFTAFDKSKIDAWHHGFFFTDSKDMASSYSLSDTDILEPYTPITFNLLSDFKRWLADPANAKIARRIWLGEQYFDYEDEDGNPTGEVLSVWDLEFDGKPLYGNAPSGSFTRVQPLLRAAENVIDRAQQREAGLYSVYLSFQNPLEIDAGGAEWNEIPATAVLGKLNPDEKARLLAQPKEFLLNTTSVFGMKTDGVCAIAKLLGYDSTIIRNCKDYGATGGFRDEEPADIFVAFDPTQIKSANHNKGTFDPHDADIRNPADQTHIPPVPVAKAAQRGLALRAMQPPSNRCCTPVGLRRAAQLANRQPVSEDTMRRMLSYFQRHEVDKQGKDWGKGTSKGLQAWLCWGGDEGYAWVRRVLGV